MRNSAAMEPPMAADQSDNLQLIRGMLDAVARGDKEGFVACLTPDVEWDDREGWPGVRRMYHGHEGVRKWWDAFRRVGGEVVDVKIENLAQASGSRVLLGVMGSFRASSGAESEFQARAWYVFWLQGGKVARAQLFWDRKQALEAAGLIGQEKAAP
jgi:ketosteroid isomerase-like protein